MAQRTTLVFGTGTITFNAYPGGEMVQVIHLGPESSCSAHDIKPADMLPRGEFVGVMLTYKEGEENRWKRIDIRDIGDGTVYTDPQDLKADIDDCIASMY